MHNQFEERSIFSEAPIGQHTITETPTPVNKEVPVEPVQNHKYYSPYKEITNPEANTANPVLALPCTDLSDADIYKHILEIEATLKKLNADDASKDHNKEQRKHLITLIDAFKQIAYSSHGNDFKEFFKEPEKLTQIVDGVQGGSAKVAVQSMRLGSDVTEITADITTQYLAQFTSTGNSVKVPLWGSGFTVVINSFSELDMLNLILALSKTQMDLGTSTRGAIYSGDDIHYVSTIVMFILSHVSECSIEGWNKDNDRSIEKIMSLLNPLDIPTLQAGALQSIYPSGYPVYHPCTNFKTCGTMIEPRIQENGEYFPDSLLHFDKTIKTDWTKLPKKHNIHMTKPGVIHTVDSVKDYQKTLQEHLSNDASKAILFELETGIGNKRTIYATFKVPTYNKYVESSNIWITSITHMVEQTIYDTADIANETEIAEQRKQRIDSYVRVTEALKHTHWIDSIYINETYEDQEPVERVIKTEKAISKALESFVLIDGVVDKLATAVQKYKESMITTWTGVPNFECPKCKSGQTSEDSKTPSLIPLNMTAYFFTIMVWRHQMRHM